jgi:protein-tyrosine phosphatase
MQKILMVCLGNICRSPMAEGIMRSRASEQKIPLFIDSAGTSGLHSGESPDRRAISCMSDKGIDIQHLKARQFQKKDLDEFDLIFAMDHSNLTDILKQTSNDIQRSKVKLFLEPFGNKSVPDPWYGDLDGFYRVYDMLDEAARYHLAQLKSTNE